MIASLNAIVPMACVAAAGIAAMVAEAFTAPEIGRASCRERV